MSGYRTKGLWWFRVCGVGLFWKNAAQHPLLFSQRTGRKGFRLGRWYVEVLH